MNTSALTILGSNFDVLGNDGENILNSIDILKIKWEMDLTTTLVIHNGVLNFVKVTGSTLVIQFDPSQTVLYDAVSSFGLKDGVADRLVLSKGFFTDKNNQMIDQDFELEIEILN